MKLEAPAVIPTIKQEELLASGVLDAVVPTGVGFDALLRSRMSTATYFSRPASASDTVTIDRRMSRRRKSVPSSGLSLLENDKDVIRVPDSV